MEVGGRADSTSAGTSLAVVQTPEGPEKPIRSMPIPRSTRSERLQLPMVFGLAICIALPLTPAVVEDATTKAIRNVMEDNYAASDAEDMSRFLKTMSHGKSHRELFIGKNAENNRSRLIP